MEKWVYFDDAPFILKGYNDDKPIFRKGDTFVEGVDLAFYLEDENPSAVLYLDNNYKKGLAISMRVFNQLFVSHVDTDEDYIIDERLKDE